MVAHAIGSIGLQVMTGGPYREIMQKVRVARLPFFSALCSPEYPDI